MGEKVGEQTGEKVGESLGEIDKLNLCRVPAFHNLSYIVFFLGESPAASDIFKSRFLS